MPSTSAKQAKFMAAVAHNPAFAKKVGVPVSVGKDFNQADKGTDMKKTKKMAMGGVAGAPAGMPMQSNMGGAARGLDRAAAMSGRTMPMTGRPVTTMAKGGTASKRADGVASKGKTKGTMVAMKRGGKC